ncbi:MAG: hypothetical protein H6760_00570 [Candidatus Nomurabacteria bacterium]|nr:MAG: hypothetical protein H6760_00570 [Candidatus Nomurabacteria bacterium]
MRQVLLLLTLILLCTGGLYLANTAQAQEKPELLFFYGQGCPHCAVVEQYIEDENLDERFRIIAKEVYGDPENARDLTQQFQVFHVPESKQGVPFMVLGAKYYVGDVYIIEAIENYADSEIIHTEAPNVAEEQGDDQLHFFPVVGAALVDAINPCAFAVLIILMATVIASQDRRRALLAGLSFSFAIFLSYLAMGFGLYSAIAAASATTWVTKLAAGMAILLGLFNLKDALWYGKGVLMEVPMSWRPRMKKLIRSVTHPLSAFGAGILVSLFLLPCTSGPYIVIIGMLSSTESINAAVLWLILYNVIFILPMLGLTLAVYFGLQPSRLEEIRQSRLRLLHAIAGIILLSLGLYLLL